MSAELCGFSVSVILGRVEGAGGSEAAYHLKETNLDAEEEPVTSRAWCPTPWVVAVFRASSAQHSPELGASEGLEGTSVHPFCPEGTWTF